MVPSIDLGLHHIRPASRGSQRSASKVTLTEWSSTDSAASLICCTMEPAYGQNGVVRTILISDDSLPMIICLMRASSTTSIPNSGSTTPRSAASTASSVARRPGSKAATAADVSVVAVESVGLGAVASAAGVVSLMAPISYHSRRNSRIRRARRANEQDGLPRREPGRSVLGDGLRRAGPGAGAADYDPRNAQFLRQHRGLLVCQARADQCAVAAEELAVERLMIGRVPVGLGDPDYAQLRLFAQ